MGFKADEKTLKCLLNGDAVLTKDGHEKLSVMDVIVKYGYHDDVIQEPIAYDVILFTLRSAQKYIKDALQWLKERNIDVVEVSAPSPFTNGYLRNTHYAFKSHGVNAEELPFKVEKRIMYKDGIQWDMYEIVGKEIVGKDISEKK